MKLLFSFNTKGKYAKGGMMRKKYREPQYNVVDTYGSTIENFDSYEEANNWIFKNGDDSYTVEIVDENDDYAKGGKINEEEGVDLFADNDGNDIPPKVQAILDKYEERLVDGMDYKEFVPLHDELYAIGYTFELGLSGEPYDLRKIGQRGKSEFYAKGGELDGGSNLEMLRSNVNEAKHHVSELEKLLKKDIEIEAWVVAKAERSTTDLSDITHYLDGLQ